MGIKKRIFKCTGCGEKRPCFFERNQEAHELDGILFTSDNLKCIADETNATGYKWEEIDLSQY